jgi:hypothetical protein
MGEYACRSCAYIGIVYQGLKIRLGRSDEPNAGNLSRIQYSLFAGYKFGGCINVLHCSEHMSAGCMFFVVSF